MRTTVLNAVHRELGAKLVEFGGFEMPIQYTSIVEEHHVVRKAAGLFDLCHMGRFEIRGERAVEAVNHVVTNDVAKMKLGQIRYSLVLNHAGGVRDDILIYRMPDSVYLVVNAGNRDKLVGWFAEHLVRPGATFRDLSERQAMIAVQGPHAEGLIAPLVTTGWVSDIKQLGYYQMSDARIKVGGRVYTGFISRTGYTGEDGFEFYVPSEDGASLWRGLAAACGDRLRPCGLGARDTLRMEAGMPLYGHELEEDLNPLEAGLDFGIKLQKPGGFIGREPLIASTVGGLKRRLRGFTVDGKKVARQGMAVYAGERCVGKVTSGAPSPTFGKSIAMALVESAVGDAKLEVDVRGSRAPLVDHPLPFYQRPRRA
ncbi:MAG: glycine cleavage system aminomethyltransferase GcvT [Planctomycetota bacterium]